MSAPEIKGWCPGALRPMLSGDGWLLRIRPRTGRLSGVQATEIARLSRRHGNGLIDLSQRANLQLRGVREGEIEALVAGLDALGLIDDDVAAEARRNIIVSPFWRADDGTLTLAETLEAALASPDAPRLPKKFGFAIDCGARPVLCGISADIRLERNEAGALICRADGAGTGAIVTPEEAIPAMIALARWFSASGGTGRMAGHLAAGAALPPRFIQAPANTQPEPAPAPGLLEAGALIGFAFGQMTTGTLAELAALGSLRVTPWRMLLVEGAAALPALPGLITDPADPLRRVIACAGAPGCAQAKAPVRELARELAPLVPANGLLHVSGCAKGCAHPKTAPITLVATGNGIALIRDGNAADLPTRTGLDASAAAIREFL